MTLLVRNEADILDANIRWHLHQGVDHILVTDHLSTDATPDILEEFQKSGAMTVSRQTDPQYAQAPWVTAMARQAATMGASWVINADADEFWMPPADDDLAGFFKSQRWPRRISGHRHNMLYGENSSLPFWMTMIWQDRHSRNANGSPLPSKIAHRATPRARVAMGNHDVRGVGWSLQSPPSLDVLHFPIRGPETYREKVRVGAAALRQTSGLATAQGSTWISQDEELTASGSTAFLRSLHASRTRILSGLADATVLRNTRLRDGMTRIYNST